MAGVRGPVSRGRDFDRHPADRVRLGLGAWMGVGRGCAAWRSWTTSARMLSATSSGTRAPRSRPAGLCTCASASREIPRPIRPRGSPRTASGWPPPRCTRSARRWRPRCSPRRFRPWWRPPRRSSRARGGKRRQVADGIDAVAHHLAQPGQRARTGRLAEDQQLRRRQHRLQVDVHAASTVAGHRQRGHARAVVRLRVWRERHEPRPSLLERQARLSLHGGLRAVAAQPAVIGAVGGDDGHVAGLAPSC